MHTCMPSWPEMPTPTSATWIILTSFAPSPEHTHNVTQYNITHNITHYCNWHKHSLIFQMQWNTQSCQMPSPIHSHVHNFYYFINQICWLFIKLLVWSGFCKPLAIYCMSVWLIWHNHGDNNVVSENDSVNTLWLSLYSASNNQNLKTNYSKGFIKRVLTYSKGHDSQWVTNKSNDLALLQWGRSAAYDRSATDRYIQEYFL